MISEHINKSCTVLYKFKVSHVHNIKTIELIKYSYYL